MSANLHLVPSPDAPRPPPTAAEQKWVLLGLPMVQQCAKEIAREFRSLVRVEDLLGPGTIALYAAAHSYDEAEHPSFAIYARHTIRGRMLDAIRTEHVSLSKRVERAMVRAYDRLAGYQKVDVDMFNDSPERIVEGNEAACDDSLAAAFWGGILEAQGASPEEIMAELEGQVTTFEMIRDALDSLVPNERQVIHLVYYEKKTLDEVAEVIDASVNTAQRRHVSALHKLRAFLVWRGVRDPRLLQF